MCVNCIATCFEKLSEAGKQMLNSRSLHLKKKKMLFISIYFLMESSSFCPQKDVGTVDAKVYFNKIGRNPEMMFSERFL